ncbi:Uncharacterised protein [Mycobacteroides abscessus subsp. abscessus]|nr:Uncharacterised protein [Mycobacteroides abscessus subsp. abscessus]
MEGQLSAADNMRVGKFLYQHFFIIGFVIDFLSDHCLNDVFMRNDPACTSVFIKDDSNMLALFHHKLKDPFY